MGYKRRCQGLGVAGKKKVSGISEEYVEYIRCLSRALTALPHDFKKLQHSVSPTLCVTPTNSPPLNDDLGECSYRCLLCSCGTADDSFLFLNRNVTLENMNVSPKSDITNASSREAFASPLGGEILLQKMWMGIQMEKAMGQQYLGSNVYVCGCKTQTLSTLPRSHTASTLIPMADGTGSSLIPMYDCSINGHGITGEVSNGNIQRKVICQDPESHYPRKPKGLPINHPLHNIVYIFPEQRPIPVLKAKEQENKPNRAVVPPKPEELNRSGRRKRGTLECSKTRKRNNYVEVCCLVGERLHKIQIKASRYGPERPETNKRSRTDRSRSNEYNNVPLSTYKIWDFVQGELAKDLQNEVAYPGALLDENIQDKCRIHDLKRCSRAVSLCQGCRSFLSQIPSDVDLLGATVSYVQDKLYSRFSEGYH